MKSLLGLVGMKYRPPADRIVYQLQPGDPVTLVREPDNPHDPNAIAVMLHLGYVPKAQALKLAEKMDLSFVGNGIARLKGRFVASPSPQIEIEE